MVVQFVVVVVVGEGWDIRDFLESGMHEADAGYAGFRSMISCSLEH